MHALPVRASVAVILAAGLLAAACGSGSDGATAAPGSSSQSAGQTRLEAAVQHCKLADKSNTVRLGDPKRIIIDTGRYGSRAGLDCLERELQTSDVVLASIGSTTSAQGVRNADDKGLHYRWTYELNSGLDMTIQGTQANGK